MNSHNNACLSDIIILDAENIKKHLNDFYLDVGCGAFNESPDIGIFLRYLQNRFDLKTAIETGTKYGATTRYFSLFYDEVYSIEISNEYFNRAKQFLNTVAKNVILHLGSSPTILRQILPPLKNKRVLFYLDAHWDSYWPLLDELEEICQSHPDNCLIVIDDIKVPSRPEIPYDQYNGLECSYDYIKNHLSRIFTKYTYHYLIPSNPQMRAKLIVYPAQWT